MARYRFVSLIFLLFVFTACDQVSTSAPRITNFSASPLDASGNATLSWRVSGEVTSLTVDQGVGEVTGQSSVSVRPAQSTTYTLTARNAQGENSARTTVTVTGEITPPPAGDDSAAPTGSFGVSKDANPPFQNDSGGNIESRRDNRIVKVKPGGTFYVQVAYEDPSGVTDVEVNLVNSKPAGVSGPLDPEQGFFTLGSATGMCDLSNNPVSVTCIYPITVAGDALNIDELDNAGGEFAYVFRTKVTDAAGNVSDEAIRGYVVVTGDDAPNPPGPNNRAPKADFSAAQEENSLEVKFSAQASSDPDGDKLSYSWDFSDGSSASSRDYTKTYGEAKDYQVKLTVSDGQGGEDTETKTITVEEVKSEPEPKPEPETCTNPVNMPDEDLKYAILGTTESELTCEDLVSLTYLYAGFDFDDSGFPGPIGDLEGLQFAVNLTELDLADNALSDISLLTNLTKLTRLDLGGNIIADLIGLDTLTNLTELDLSDNRINTLTNLENLTGLTSLDLSRNDISDLTGLGNLASLAELNLESNDISRLGELESLKSLTKLELSDNSVIGLTGLGNLTNLAELDLSNNGIADLGTLGNPTGLVELDLTGNNITDLTTLENLADLPTLVRLVLRDNGIANLVGLENLPSLSDLDLRENNIASLAGLKNLPSLSDLDLRDNSITNLAGFENLPRLSVFYLSNNKITDLTPLKELPSLTDLSLARNAISDLTGLESLPNLMDIFLVTNLVKDISPLVANDELGAGDSVSLNGNPLSSQALRDVEVLRGRGVDVFLR